MTVGKSHLGQPAVRRAFLKALRAHGNIGRAAKAAGVTRNAVNYQRQRYPAFDADLRAALPADGEVKSWAPWTAERKAVFLGVLGECGCAAKAAAACGGSEGGAYKVRATDKDFAAAWMDAKREAHDRVEGLLFEGALHGFVSTRTAADGGVATTRWQSAAAMFKLLAMRPPLTSYRTMEMTPERLAEARWKFERTLAHGMDSAIAAFREGRPIPYPQPPPYLTSPPELINRPGKPWPNALYPYGGASAVTATGPVLTVAPAVTGYRVLFRG